MFTLVHLAFLTILVVAPSTPGFYNLNFTIFQSGKLLEAVKVPVEVTCSDGVFCNGMERWVNGRCVPGLVPCNDDDSCTADTCDEDSLV